ncbi:MAG TPA: hypothetical protein VIY51_21775 [Xanthobacteraceae bacterium]
MSKFMLRPLALAIIVAFVPLSNALAHCVVGNRFFPAMLATDDPCVADEMSLPTVQYNSANPSGREHDVGVDFAKRFTESFGVVVSSTWTRVSPPADAGTNGPIAYGFQNLVTTAQFQLLKDAQHELALLAGVIVNWGSSGAAGVGAAPWSAITPTFYFGKGFGDLPDGAGFLRAFAVTGQVGYEVPTTSLDLVSGNPVPQNLVWGTSLQFSMPYLKSSVVDLGLPDFFNHLIPIVEAQFVAPVANNFGNDFIITGTVNPGVIWVGTYFQVGVEAIVPINHASGTSIGGIAQLHLYLDDIFPTTLGQPLFGSSAPMKSMARR